MSERTTRKPLGSVKSYRPARLQSKGDRAREQLGQELYEIVAHEMALFITEYSVEVRKPREWDELPNEAKIYWFAKADAILAIPEVRDGLLAVEKGWNAKVDREAELPENTRFYDNSWQRCGDGIAGKMYKDAQQDMLKAGWVKEASK